MNKPKGTGRQYRMRARREAVERTRERILVASYELWLVMPYEEMTLDAVAARAGVTRQTVIRQFGSKEKLVVAAVDWLRPREESKREAAPGDVVGAVGALVGRYEEMGDANVRVIGLEERVPEIGHLIREGRRSHRGWIERMFRGWLTAQPDAEREEATLALYAATDVMTWKLLRRDFGRSRAEVERTMCRLIEGVLTGNGSGTKEGCE